MRLPAIGLPGLRLSTGYKATGYKATGYKATGYKAAGYKAAGYKAAGYKTLEKHVRLHSPAPSPPTHPAYCRLLAQVILYVKIVPDCQH